MRLLKVLLMVLGCLPLLVAAQTGRGIVTAEAFVGRAHSVYVGTIRSLDGADSKVPIDSNKHYGQAFRMIFDVSETIRGKAKSQVTIILLLQHSIYLDYLVRHHVELAIAVGKNCRVGDIGSETIVEVDGQNLLGEEMQFRILEKLRAEEDFGIGPEAREFNVSMDEGKMFDFEFNLLTSRDEVLKHFRAFEKKHPKVLPTIWVRVPHQFGRLCGYTNAYMGVGFPVCAETKATLQKMVDHPEAFMERYESKDPEADRKAFIEAGKKGLADFDESV